MGCVVYHFIFFPGFQNILLWTETGRFKLYYFLIDFCVFFVFFVFLNMWGVLHIHYGLYKLCTPRCVKNRTSHTGAEKFKLQIKIQLSSEIFRERCINGRGVESCEFIKQLLDYFILCIIFTYFIFLHWTQLQIISVLN